MRPRGNILGVTVTPTQSSASGIWHLREAEAFNRAGTWPTLAGAPTSLTATAGSGSVTLSWTAPSSVGGSSFVSYSVQYTPSGGSTTTLASLGPSTSYTVTGLTAGVAHTFAVAAVNNLGTGPYSTTVTATPLSSFTPTAVLLTSGTSYTVPSGATSMKAWAVGGGSLVIRGGAAGGCAFKTWNVTGAGGQTISYSVAPSIAARSGTVAINGQNTTVTYAGTTITGFGATGSASGGGSSAPGSFSGGDGGATGGVKGDTSGGTFGGAVGGNGTVATCGRRAMTDVSGLLAALSLAGVDTTERCNATAAFGSGGWGSKFSAPYVIDAGVGGGSGFEQGGFRNSAAGGGAVVLYFT